MKKMMDDFKAFALKGNVIDLAVWVIIAWAFGKIVSSLVSDIIMPIIWVIAGGVDFKELGYTVTNVISGTQAKISYGLFLQNVFDFIVVAFSLFLFVTMLQKWMDKVKKKDHKTE